MKVVKILVLFLVLALHSSCGTKERQDSNRTSPTEEAVKKTELTIMSYNVRHCSPPGDPELIDVEAIAEIIRNSGAALVGLQEIDVNNGRSGTDLDQAARLGELTGMNFYFSKGIDYNGGAYGTAILSKYPITDMQTVKLPMAEGTEQRTLSLVTVTLPGENNIRFANTHLDYSSDANALAQAKVIVETLKAEKLPVFITGDFNVVEDSNTFRHLDQLFSSTCEGDCMPTIPADSPAKTIDFIFYSKTEQTEVRMHEVLDEPTASDHRPVLAKLAW